MVCSVDAEVKTKTEQSFANAEISAIIGEAPTDDPGGNISRLFLRDSEVLLQPREIQISIGFNYNTNENQRSFRKNRNRSISIPLNISYGLTKKLEVNASLPFLYNENEIISATNVSDSSKSGVGDLALGLFYTLKSESSSSPSITSSINVTTPTGSTADPADLNDLSTGGDCLQVLVCQKRLIPPLCFLVLAINILLMMSNLVLIYNPEIPSIMALEQAYLSIA